ncbi:MAG: polysaccharide pyruvyl transferase family protein [Lachnospiraceae bacterium]|nr:polysaccharide pyruvyl transferase family protein [Lachnospiraceae bacterium]
MKILVLGSYYSDNLGDGLLCECAAWRLGLHFPEAEIEIFDLLDRKSFGRKAGVSMRQLNVNRRRLILRRLVSKYRIVDKQLLSSAIRMEDNRAAIERAREAACDLAVFAGGQLLMDSYALIMEAYLRVFEEKGVPVFLNACGTGPSVSREVRERLGAALLSPNVRLISCRDDVSLLNRLYLKGKREAVESFDPALWCGPRYGLEKNAGSRVIGLGVMYPDTERISARQAASFWLRLIGLLEERGVRWKLFVNGGVSDLCFAEHICGRLGRRPEDCMAAIPSKPGELPEVIAQFRGIISFRLHSHIAAASLGIPSAAICWDDKVRFFFRKIGCPERCLTHRDRPERVLEALEAALWEGVDASVIEEGRRFQDGLLCGRIEEVINGTDS